MRLSLLKQLAQVEKLVSIASEFKSGSIKFPSLCPYPLNYCSSKSLLLLFGIFISKTKNYIEQNHGDFFLFCQNQARLLGEPKSF